MSAVHAVHSGILPHLDVENNLVHILLCRPEKILTKHLEPRWFEKNYRIIEAMLSLAGKGVTIDVFSVSKELGGKGLNQLIEIQKNGIGAPENYAIKVDEMRSKFEARAVRSAIESALTDIDRGTEPTVVLSSLIADAMKVSSIEGKSHTYTAKEAMMVFVDKLTEIHEARDTGGIGLKTGIDSLDKVLGGLQPSDMVIVGARPGVGKTAFALSVLRSLAKQDKRVGFFSTEMAVFQVMSRLASLESNVPAVKLRHADLSDEDYSRISAATQSIAAMSFRICDKPAITVGELSMQARAWMADGGIDFIAVDYLTRLHPDKPSHNQNQVQDVGNIVTALKNLARNLNIPVMVLAQLNRGSTARSDKTPVMSDLRDSGVIEQEADQILMLYRPEEDAAEVIVDKNRHGECGAVRCVFDPETMHWMNIEAGQYDF